MAVSRIETFRSPVPNNTSDLKIPKIALFTWNTQSCSIGADEDFELPPTLFEETPELVVFATQEDRKPGSYLHSDVLPLIMAAEGYKLMENSRIMGVGKTTYQGLWKRDFFLRGCRISCYLRGDLIHLDVETSIDYYFCSWLLRNKGAISIFCDIPGYRPCLFINCHLPIESPGSFPGNDWLTDAERISLSNYYLTGILKHHIKPLKKWPLIFLLGDLNYRCKHVTEEQLAAMISNSDFESWKKIDEFSTQIQRGNIPSFYEGIGNQGPQFFPTYKMQTGREPGSLIYRRGIGLHRTPAWTDRICGLLEGELECRYYERWENPLTIRSDHCAVWALFAPRG